MMNDLNAGKVRAATGQWLAIGKLGYSVLALGFNVIWMVADKL